MAEEAWRDRNGKEFHAGTHYYVGGNTKFYGAALFRLREEDFGIVRHHGGLSPAWPIPYSEMEPYYLAAEHLYEVRGERGEDPTDPKASGGYRFPKISHEPRIQKLHDDLTKLGLSPFHVPLGVRLDEGSVKSKCIRCSTCDGFPCLVWAKSDAQTMCVDPALERPTYTVKLDAIDEVLTVNGRVTPVDLTRLSFKRDGRVNTVGFARGDTVKQGDLLAELQQEEQLDELREAQDGLVQSRRDLENAQWLLSQIQETPEWRVLKLPSGARRYTAAPSHRLSSPAGPGISRSR